MANQDTLESLQIHLRNVINNMGRPECIGVEITAFVVERLNEVLLEDNQTIQSFKNLAEEPLSLIHQDLIRLCDQFIT